MGSVLHYACVFSTQRQVKMSPCKSATTSIDSNTWHC